MKFSYVYAALLGQIRVHGVEIKLHVVKILKVRSVMIPFLYLTKVSVLDSVTY